MSQSDPKRTWHPGVFLSPSAFLPVDLAGRSPRKRRGPRLANSHRQVMAMACRRP